MSTFIEDNDPTKNSPTTSTPKITTAAVTNIPFSDYMNSLNTKYQEKIKLAAQRSNYTLELVYEDGKTTHYTYTRMKLLQWQFDEIEELRSESAELAAASSVNAVKASKKLKEMYLKAAKYLFFNTTTEKPMTEDEYRHCYFPELRPVIDASILLSLISDPN